jgi:hypothetical protein
MEYDKLTIHDCKVEHINSGDACHPSMAGDTRLGIDEAKASRWHWDEVHEPQPTSSTSWCGSG